MYPGALPAAGSSNTGDTLAVAGHTALHNTAANESRAIASKIGTGSSTPTSGVVLRGNGVGTSAWGQVVLTTDVTGTLPQGSGGTGTILATGTGAVVYQTSPTITTPTITTPTITTPSISDPSFSGIVTGWVTLSATLTYSSFDVATDTGIMNTSVDLSGVISTGMKFRISQSTGGTKYFYVTAVSPTQITGFFGTDYTLNNETISSPNYSVQGAPFGFPLGKNKWTITATGTSQRTPAVSTSFASATDTITVPVGSWRLIQNPYLLMSHDATGTTGRTGYCTLSSDASTETNPLLTIAQLCDMPGAGTGTLSSGSKQTAQDDVVLTVPTTFTAMMKVDATAQVSSWEIRGELSAYYIRAIINYP
jgi:hypothetical protein